MVRLLKCRKVLIGLFIAFIAISSILVYANISWIVSHLGKVFPVLSLVFGACAWLKDRPKVFMFFAQCKALIFSGQTRWHFSAHYVIDENDFFDFPKIKEHLKRLGNNRHVFRETQGTLQMSVDGLNMQISVSENRETFTDGKVYNLHVQVFEYHAPYHETLTLMRETFVPLFESIENTFRIHKRHYGFSMLFSKSNPFYGLYFKHLELDKILDFHCVLEEGKGCNDDVSNSIVKIYKDRLDFSSISLNQLQNSAEKYLAVSWG